MARKKGFKGVSQKKGSKIVCHLACRLFGHKKLCQTCTTGNENFPDGAITIKKIKNTIREI
jgi:hypothetical protein